MIDENDLDLQKANLALKVATNLVNSNNSPVAHTSIVGKSIMTSSSELVTGPVYESLKNFFKVAASKGVVDSGAC